MRYFFFILHLLNVFKLISMFLNVFGGGKFEVLQDKIIDNYKSKF